MKYDNIAAVAVDRGDVVELLRLVDYGPCACMGPINGEPLCPCQMRSDAVRSLVSYAGLKSGRVVRIVGK